MKKSTLIGICLIILLASSALAITKSYETSAVARIVGDSPNDLKQQLLAQEDIDLKHATYLSRETVTTYADNKNILKKMFGISNTFFLGTHEGKTNLFSYDLNKFKKNELVVWEGAGSIKNNEIKSSYYATDFNPEDFGSGDFVQALQDNKPFIILDSNYAGITIPKTTNLITPYGKDATFIAPSYRYSDAFVKAFICNLRASGRSVGETFRQARNNYHWGTTMTSENIGLTLFGYHLYGNPLPELTVPTYKESDIDNYCDNYLVEYEKANDLFFSIMSQINESPGASPYIGKFTYRITDYSVEDKDNFSIISINSPQQEYQVDDLVLPREILASPYPLKTIMQNVSVVALEDPVDITVENLPSWNGENFTERECYQDTQPASVNFGHSYTEDSEAVLIEINPVEVVNCTTGEFILYRTIKYNIDYIPFSPILIEQITHESNVGPGETTEIEITLKNVKSHAVNGKLIIKDEDGNDLKHILTSVHTAATKKYQIEFEVPQEQGLRQFIVEYYENNDKKTQSKFFMAVSQIIPIIDIPLIIQPDEELPVNIRLVNNGPQQDIDYTLKIKEGEEVKASYSDTIDLDEGENNIHYIFDTKEISYGFYTLEATFSYHNPFNNATETLKQEKIFLIISLTPTPPYLDAPDDVTIKEGERITIIPAVYDINGDPVTLEFKSPARSDGIFQTKEGDQGKYDIEIIASDGTYNISDTFTVTVENMPLVVDTSSLTSDSVSFLTNGGRQATFLKILKKARVTSASLTVSGSSGYELQDE